VCGRAIVVDDEDDDRDWGPYNSGHVNVSPPASASDITAENPAPKGFTSWGWERDREFRQARHARRVWEGKEEE
jgi:hypothetical protein